MQAYPHHHFFFRFAWASTLRTKEGASLFVIKSTFLKLLKIWVKHTVINYLQCNSNRLYMYMISKDNTLHSMVSEFLKVSSILQCYIGFVIA